MSTIFNCATMVSIHWTCLLFTQLILFSFKRFNLTLLLPRLVCLMSCWPLTFCVSWCVWLTVCCRSSAAKTRFLLAMLDWWWTRPVHCFSTIHNAWCLWFITHWSSFLFLWWFVASRWEHNHWHHPIGPFLWEEREGRAYIWWLLQVLNHHKQYWHSHKSQNK